MNAIEARKIANSKSVEENIIMIEEIIRVCARFNKHSHTFFYDDIDTDVDIINRILDILLKKGYDIIDNYELSLFVVRWEFAEEGREGAINFF